MGIDTSRRRRHRFARRLTAAAATIGLTGATAAALPGQAASAAAPKIQYTARTVLVPAATVKAELMSVSPNGATYTFKNKAGVLGKLTAGKVMLLEHLAVRDVTKTAVSKGHLVVSTKPAELTDFLYNGTLTWNTAVDFAKGFAVSGGAVPKGLRPAAVPGGIDPAVAQRFGARPMGAGGITLKGKIDGYGYSINFKQVGAALSVAITISMSNPVDLEVTITGTLHNLRTAGNIAVNKGKLSNAKVLANSLQGSFKLAYTAKPLTKLGLGTSGGIKITLPGELTVPFFLGPVPFFLGVKVAFFASAGFSQFNQELSGSYTFTYNGSGGFSASKSGATSAAGILKGLGDIILTAANAVKTGPISFIFGAQMPQLELGLGVKGLNVAGFVTPLISTGIATFGAGCDTRKIEAQAVAGAQANFFGFNASASATLFDKSVYASFPKGCGTFPG